MVTVADIPYLNVKPLDIPKFIQATNNKYPEIYNVFKYYTDNGYTIYSEIGVYLIDYLISGTIDILCIREDQFVILDWKTNKDGLKFESGYYRRDKSQKPWQLTNDWVSKKKLLKHQFHICLIVMVVYILFNYLCMLLWLILLLVYLVLV